MVLICHFSFSHFRCGALVFCLLPCLFFYFVDILHNDKCRYRKQTDSDKCESEILYHHKSLKSLMYLLMRKVETITDTNFLVFHTHKRHYNSKKLQSQI